MLDNSVVLWYDVYRKQEVYLMKMKPKQLRSAMSKEELRTYYEQVKNSARVSENKKKYKRVRVKREKIHD